MCPVADGTPTGRGLGFGRPTLYLEAFQIAICTPANDIPANDENMWSSRSVTTSALVALGLLERQAPQTVYIGSYWDIGELPIPAGKLKAAPGERPVPNTIVVHITAVRGGFGVSRRAVKRWRDALETRSLGLPTGLLCQLQVAGLVSSTQPRAFDPDALAHRLALWERYRSTPYHMIAAPNGDAVANRDLCQRTYHGNAGNYGVGFAVDCGPGEALSEMFVSTAQHALRKLVLRMSIRAGNMPEVRIVSHRQYSASRRQDPGAEVWRQVVLPVASEDRRIVLVHGEHTGGGLPIPNTWDPGSPYDERGKWVKGT